MCVPSLDEILNTADGLTSPIPTDDDIAALREEIEQLQEENRQLRVRAETMVMELLRRGEEKALADIEFTILKGGKSILDSANDFEKRKRPGGGKQKEEPIF